MAIEGVTPRHRGTCTAKGWARCRCQPSYRAEVWDNDNRRRLTKTFPTSAAAKSWRIAKINAVRSGTAAALEPTVLEVAIETWIARAEAGVVRNKSGLPYKPSVLRNYSSSLRQYVAPKLGSRRLSDIHVGTVQDFVDGLVKSGLMPSSVRNIIAPLRVIFNDAMRRKLALANPVVGVALPGCELSRDRIATPQEAEQLLSLLVADQALWATAFYTGLRRGELQALDWGNVDLVARTINVERSYDPRAQEYVRTKTKHGTRVLPFPGVLVPYLAALDGTTGLVFGRSAALPFSPESVRQRANKAWEDAGAAAITLHECRHTYASLMLSAGVDIWKVSKYMGHSGIQITVDRYGHLVKGTGADDMAKFETYLSREPVQ